MHGFSNKIDLNGILERISNNDTSRTRLSIQSSIKMVATGFIAGAKSLLGVIATWNDKLLAELAGLTELPDDTTLGRSFKRQNKQTIADFESLPFELERSVTKNFISTKIMRMNARKEELIDIDGTDIVSYGHQQGSIKGFNHKKKGANCYQSLLAFDSISKTVKLAWLQSGNTHCVNGIVEFCRQLHAQSPNQRKFYRLDSGFFAEGALREIENQKNGYLIKAKLTNSFHKSFPELDWKVVPDKPGRRGWEEAEFMHACTGWSKERKFSVVRIKTDSLPQGDGLFPDYIVDKYAYFCYTSTKLMSPWSLHKFYGERATCENLIDELKNQMNLGKIRSKCFDATTLLFHCSILAYNLLKWMAVCSSNKKLQQWEVSSIRCFLIRIAARVRNHRKMTIEIHDQHLYQDEIDIWMRFCSS